MDTTLHPLAFALNMSVVLAALLAALIVGVAWGWALKRRAARRLPLGYRSASDTHKIPAVYCGEAEYMMIATAAHRSQLDKDTWVRVTLVDAALRVLRAQKQEKGE